MIALPSNTEIIDYSDVIIYYKEKAFSVGGGDGKIITPTFEFKGIKDKESHLFGNKEMHA